MPGCGCARGAPATSFSWTKGSHDSESTQAAGAETQRAEGLSCPGPHGQFRGRARKDGARSRMSVQALPRTLRTPHRRSGDHGG